MHLYLIRHGQSFINLTDWNWSGGATLDQPLTDLGVRQAEALAAWLPGHVPTIAGLYASSMRRARQTAEQLAQVYGCETCFEDRVREIGNNRIDHTAWPEDEAPNRYSPVWVTARPFSPTMHDAETSETYMHTRVRVGLFIEELVQWAASDDAQHWLKVKVQSGRPHERTFYFADENRSLLVAVKLEIGGRAIYVNSIWKYIDAKTAP